MQPKSLLLQASQANMGPVPPPGPFTVETRGRGNSGGHKTRVFSWVRVSVESANSLKINDDEF